MPTINMKTSNGKCFESGTLNYSLGCFA